MHARFISFFFAFSDDFVVELTNVQGEGEEGEGEGGQGLVVAFVQSATRIGTNDHGTNQRRVQKYISFLNNYSWNSTWTGVATKVKK